MAGRKTMWRIAGPKFVVRGVAFCPKNGDVISLDTGDGVSVWAAANGAAVLPVPQGCKAESAQAGVQFSWQGDEHLSFNDKNVILIMNLRSGTVVRSLKGHKAVASCHICDPDKGLFVSGAQDGSLRVWNLQTETCIDMIGRLAWVTAAALDKNGNRVAIGCADKSVLLWG